jgi:hypothetical protein
LPAAFVERADGGDRKGEVVGDEHQRLIGFGVLEADAPWKPRFSELGPFS